MVKVWIIIWSHVLAVLRCYSQFILWVLWLHVQSIRCLSLGLLCCVASCFVVWSSFVVAFRGFESVILVEVWSLLLPWPQLVRKVFMLVCFYACVFFCYLCEQQSIWWQHERQSWGVGSSLAKYGLVNLSGNTRSELGSSAQLASVLPTTL